MAFSGFEKKSFVLNDFSKGSVFAEAPPGVFVSSKSYPKLKFSPLLPVSSGFDPWFSDDSDKWFGLPLEQIISFRRSLARGSMSVVANQAVEHSYDVLSIQESLLASRPVDVEALLGPFPKNDLLFSDYHAPVGPESSLEYFKVVGNVKVNRFVEKAFYDFDLNAEEALSNLFFSGVGVSQLAKVFSAGMLGVKKRRSFVPTRWAITAVDSSLSESLVEDKIKGFACIDSFLVFSSDYLDNYYYVVLAPFNWSFELFEAYLPVLQNSVSKENVVVADHEFFNGRSSYAENTAGGYYAARLAVAEYLARERKQACVVIFREIKSELPSVGVWKCREIVRDALRKNPLVFSSLDLVLSYLGKKLSLPLNVYLKKSFVLDGLLHQKRIFDFV